MKWLTKSDYLKFLIHPAYFWLAKHAKDKLPPFGETAQAAVDQGYAVEREAARLFPGAIAVDATIFDGPDVTAGLMKAGGPATLLQPSVLTERKLYARCDILKREGEAWDIYEIKGSAAVKPAHLLDLAFQKFVLEEAGHQVGRSFVVHINPSYVRDGPLDPTKLFMTIDVTEQVEPLAKDTAKKVEEALEVLQTAAMPSDAPAEGADWYGYRDVFKHLHPELDASSIYRLTRLTLEQIKALDHLKITKITDIPADFELKSQQVAQIALRRAGRPIIQLEQIKRQLDTLIYPLYFLDYETFASTLPLWDGVQPFQQLPFQYSLHIIGSPGAPVQHREYLARGPEYPVSKLLASLQTDLGADGSIIVWNQAFEMGCNDAMATLHPEYAPFLQGINGRVFDLMDIFARGYYGHPDFDGSASIKKVLPVLVPELSYKTLGISEGLTAQVRWMKAARGQMSPTEAHILYEDLVKYCGQDTLAMVRIFGVLQQTLNPQ